MDHDPLCYMSEGKWDGGCQCDLIRKVRADERDQARQAVVAVPWQSSMLGAMVMRAEVVAALERSE